MRGCTPPSPEAATTSRSTTPTPSRRRAPTSRTCRRAGAAPVPTLRGRGAGCAAHRRRRPAPTSASRSTCTSSSTALVDADSFFEVKPLFAPEVIVGLRAARRATDRDRGQQLDAQGGRAVRRLVGQGGPLHLVLRRLRHPVAVPRRRARVHGRHRGRAAGDHPARRQDDHRGVGGDGAEGLGHRAQGVRRRPLRVRGTGVRAPMPASRCRRRASR